MKPNEPLSIVMFSTEAVPFVKVGGLADVVGALPKFLGKAGTRITLVLPDYRAIAHDLHGIEPFRPVPELDVAMGSGSARAGIFRTHLPGTESDVFFIGSGQYFDRDGVYDDPLTQRGFPDNMERYVFFMKAGLKLLSQLGRPVDVIHCHDFQTALIPAMLSTSLLEDPQFSRTGSLFTIHNLAFQGIYPKESLDWAAIDDHHFYPFSPFEFWGKVNFMKAGIEYADLVNTVSETYAAEIQSGPEYGYGLEGVLRSRGSDLRGIVNGIDYEEWNPRTDHHIASHFSAGDLAGKAHCKTDVLECFGLPQPPEAKPLIGMVSRLADQKGLDLIEAAAGALGRLDVQMVFLGYGQQRYHEFLEDFASRYPEKAAVKISFDEPLAHKIYAGCDLCLMPSRYEPCGLSQIIGLRYGTVPIVRATGGLADTVTDCDPQAGIGTGFTFKEYTSTGMMNAVGRALALYSDASRWGALVARCMSQDWSWGESARKYLQLYDRICQRRRGT